MQLMIFDFYIRDSESLSWNWTVWSNVYYWNVFYGGILILVDDWLEIVSVVHQKLLMYITVRCVVLFKAEIYFGVLTGH